MSLNTDLIWVIARSTGTASLVALTLSVLTGIALRTGTFAWLSHNRGVRIVHGELDARDGDASKPSAPDDERRDADQRRTTGRRRRLTSRQLVVTGSRDGLAV